MALVYMILFPNNKKYIGITSQSLEQRKAEHFSRTRTSKNCYYVHSALFKYENAEWRILVDNLSIEDAKQVEKELIMFYKSNNRHYGYNLTSGGDGIIGKKFTPEQLQRLSDAHKGIKQSPETIEKRTLKLRGCVHKDAKRIVGVNLIDNSIVVYESLTKVKKEGKFHFSSVARCCNGERKTHAGYTWKYEVLNG